MPSHEAARTQQEKVPITNQAFPLDQGPIDFMVGPEKALRIVRAADIHGQDPNDTLLVIDPQYFNPSGQVGYTILPEGGDILLGRDHEHDYRFKFDGDIEPVNARIKREDGNVYIEDLSDEAGVFHLPDGITSSQFKLHEVVSEAENAGEAEYSISAAAATTAADYHPLHNEDAYFIDAQAAAAGVFDAVGGVPGSAAAAQVSANSLAESLGNLPKQMTKAQSDEAVYDAVQQAHQAVISHDVERTISTTAAIVKIFEDNGEHYATVAHVGDSRVYLLRKGHLAMVTLDHAFDESKVSVDKQFELQKKLAEATEQTEMDAEIFDAFMNRNDIYSSISNNSDYASRISMIQFDLMPGDRLIMTTDGIHDNLTTKEIKKALQSHNSDEEATKFMVELARERSRSNPRHIRAKPDDMTAVILSYGEAA